MVFSILVKKEHNKAFCSLRAVYEILLTQI